MTSTITTAHTVKTAALIFETERPNQSPHRTVHADSSEAYDLGEGEFLVVSYHGYHTIGRLTGRTRQFWHDACPTIECYEVETYADDNGVIRGRRGDRVPGVFATRSHNLAKRCDDAECDHMVEAHHTYCAPCGARRFAR